MRMKTPTSLAAFASALLVLALASAEYGSARMRLAQADSQIGSGSGAGWRTYINPRFGTIADVPASGFRANPPPANGDGRSWTSADGRGKLAVYGSFMTVADSVKGYRRYAVNTARERGVCVTYQAGRGDWFAYSGFDGSNIVYAKVVVSRRCATQIANHIYLEYPRAQKARYNRVVKRMATSLRGGTGPCP